MQTTVTIDWTLVLAAYGAITATVVILWDVWKWKHAGPNLSVFVSTGMKTFGGLKPDDKLYVVMNVTNRGDRATTLTHMSVHYFPDWRAWIRGKSTYNAIVANPSAAQPIPYLLEPGKVWIGMGHQDEAIEKMAREGRLYAALTKQCPRSAGIAFLLSTATRASLVLRSKRMTKGMRAHSKLKMLPKVPKVS